MKIKIYKKIAIAFAIIIVFLVMGQGSTSRVYSSSNSQGSGKESNSASSTTPALSQEELENMVNQKTQELNKINEELSKVQADLSETKDKKESLKRDIYIIKNTIKQLELNIKADEIVNQKLELEINSINYDIRNISMSIGDKKNAIADILRKIQQEDSKNLLEILLKNETLADGVFEIQSLKNLKNQLSIDITNLANLNSDLSRRIEDVKAKKNEINIHSKNLLNRKLIVADQEKEKKVILQETENKEYLYKKKLKELRSQQQKIADEISDIEEKLIANFDVSRLPVKRPGVLSWPIKLKKDGGIGIITQLFGVRSYLYHYKPHNGLDIGVPIGTPVHAARDGVVVRTDNNDRSSWRKYQYGKYVMIKHDNNLSTLYAHLSRQVVSKGEKVKRGELIGYSGNTGYTTGPHLHFGLYWTPSVVFKRIPPASGLVPVGVVINPQDYLAE